MDKFDKLKKRIIEIEKRNKRVELDKAWERGIFIIHVDAPLFQGILE